MSVQVRQNFDFDIFLRRRREADDSDINALRQTSQNHEINALVMKF